MALLLCNLGDLILQHLLTSVHRLTKGFIGFSLSLDKALHEILKVGFLLESLGRSIIGGYILESQGLVCVGWHRIVISIGEVWLISPP